MILKKRWWSLRYRWATTTYDIYKDASTLPQYEPYGYGDGYILGIELEVLVFLENVKSFKWFGDDSPGVIYQPSYAKDNVYRVGLHMIACQGVTWIGEKPPMILFHRKRDAIRFAVRYGRLRDPSYDPERVAKALDGL